MARVTPVMLGCLLLACLAADVLAKRADPVSIAAGKAKTNAIYDCPDTPRMKGCAATGCALHMHGKSSTLVCAQCASEKAYVLVNENTRKAQCECAPGYAGKGQDGVCKKCPAGTDIAEGGAIAKSICTKCPEGSYVDEAGTDCLCPAGHYRAPAADQEPMYMKISCKPCMARTAYVDTDGHNRDSCKTCAAPLVANEDHTKCVSPESSEAAAPGEGLLGAVSKSPFGGLAHAFEEGRNQGKQERLGLPADSSSKPSLKALANRVRSALGGRRNTDAADEEEFVEEEVEAPKASSKKAAAKVEDAEDIDQALVEAEPEPVKAESQDSKHKHGHKDSHHHAEHEETEDYQPKTHKHHQHDKDTYEKKEKDSYEHAESYEKDSDKKSQYEKRAEAKVESEEQKAAKQEADRKPAPAKTEPAPAKTDKTEKPSAADSDKTDKKKASSEPKKSAQSDIANDNIAKQLIPELPTEAEMKAAAPKEAMPPTLKGFAKKLGSAFGAAPVTNPLSNPFGYIDPEALADAGLPPVKNVGQLMGALVRKQMTDMDFSDWGNGISRSTQDLF